MFKCCLFVSCLFVVQIESCSLVYNLVDDITLAQIQGQKLYNGDFPEMDTYQDVSNYVESVLTWESMKLNPITDPQEAIETGKGNCTTYAILFMNVAHFTLGVDFGFACADASSYNQRSVGSGGFPDHSMVILCGQLYSSYTGEKITEYPAGYYYSFDEVFE